MARVRRGRKPDPTIPLTLFEAEPIKDADLNMVDFSSFKDCVVYVINVASADMFTDSNYTLMADLLEKYYDLGFRILAFPSNWYGQKETGTYEEIKKFAHEKYSDKITMLTKGDLEWNEIFALGCKYFPGEVIWNFHGKFLFNRQGIPVARFDLLTPDDHLSLRVAQEVMGASAVPDALTEPAAAQNTAVMVDAPVEEDTPVEGDVQEEENAPVDDGKPMGKAAPAEKKAAA